MKRKNRHRKTSINYKKKKSSTSRKGEVANVSFKKIMGILSIILFIGGILVFVFLDIPELIDKFNNKFFPKTYTISESDDNYRGISNKNKIISHFVGYSLG